MVKRGPMWPRCDPEAISKLPCEWELSREVTCHGGRPQARIQHRGLTSGDGSEQWQPLRHRAQKRTASADKPSSVEQQFSQTVREHPRVWHARVKTILPNNPQGMSSVLAPFQPWPLSTVSSELAQFCAACTPVPSNHLDGGKTLREAVTTGCNHKSHGIGDPHCNIIPPRNTSIVRYQEGQATSSHRVGK